MTETITAEFTPEAWMNDYAVPVDPKGPTTWDATEYAKGHADYLTNLTERTAWESSVVDVDDVFKGDPSAPEWVREWSGPFTIRLFREVSEQD